MDSNGPALVRRYYDALDAADYSELDAVLAQSFVQHRPDRTFEGRAAFVEFIREERPMTDTRHDIVDVFGTNDRVTVQGRLLDGTGEPVFEFADLFLLENGRIHRLETYTR